MNFGRVLTAMVTPFDDQLRLDAEKTKTLVNYLIENGTDGIVVAGTTGRIPDINPPGKIGAV